jgi:hypothetical protein
MRKFRNPRYAPESLERKLSPTDLLGGLSVVAVVALTTSSAGSTTTPSEPAPGTGLPPDMILTGPTTGPSGPA